MARQFFTEPSGKRSILNRLRLGSKVKAVTSALGIKQCEGCKRREKKLDGIKA